jgi:hypothetical protein
MIRSAAHSHRDVVQYESSMLRVEIVAGGMWWGAVEVKRGG